MFQRKSRRFRRRSNGRGHSHHVNNVQSRLRPNSFSNDQVRNNFRSSSLSAEKLFEKYNVLAKEALSSGDKTLSENYLQHADHFMRIIEEKNRNQNQNRMQDNSKSEAPDKHIAENVDVNQEKIIQEEEKNKK